MDFIEVSSKTVEDAITKACVDMGLSSDQLDIQVISEGSSGFLGIGSKPAVIQVRRKDGGSVTEEAPAPEPAAEEKAEAQKQNRPPLKRLPKKKSAPRRSRRSFRSARMKKSRS